MSIHSAIYSLIEKYPNSCKLVNNKRQIMYLWLLTKLPWLKYWRVILLFLAIISIFCLFWYVNNQAYNRGYAQKTQEYELALKESQDKARSELAEMEKGYDKTSKDFKSLPSGGSVGAASAYSVRWLHSHYSDSK